MDYRKSAKLFRICVIGGGVCYLPSIITGALWPWFLGSALMLAGTVQYCFFCKCPHCHKFLHFRNIGKFCPKCGKRV